jgi:hypothetical protein
MAYTLQQIRDYVRSHIDLELEDLPDAVLDVFVREGSKRVERAEKRWPFYEAEYTFATVSGTEDYDIEGTFGTALSEITSIVTPEHGPIRWIGRDVADTHFPLGSDATGEPVAFSEWAGTLRLYPTPDAAYTLQVRGYRESSDWVADGAGGVPDLPGDLHNCIAQWALARAYAQQDDPEMAQLFERQFADELNFFRRRLNDSPPAQPLVMNGTRSTARRITGRLAYDWE